ncbi:uncharacterized protein VTP21DRAFT_8619 [Calcarisporiella thermophila]|uniref:uncharacterized protein n=1 Tax=Calcarisporiella thermophila TaxID=911321 RepID=UPI003743E39E
MAMNRQYQPTSNTSTLPSAGGIIGVHYRIHKKIGEGSFGIIYDGVNLLNNQRIAIKFESRKSEAPQLRDEYRAYKILAGCVGIPSVYYFGQEGMYNVLVEDLLGKSLEDLFDICGRKFTVKCVAMLAIQMITRIQTVHEKNLIYRDIKPDNFLMGRSSGKHVSTVFMVDFGMAKHYRDPRTKQHIPYRERKSLSGTARYMSVNTHLGREQSRRDDLESLGHVFMYFLRGSLPWQGLKAATNKQKYEKIGLKKQVTQIKELCAGFPEEFATYLTYARRLRFEETPDYDFLRELFVRVLHNMGETEDGIFDWMALNKSADDANHKGSRRYPHPPSTPNGTASPYVTPPAATHGSSKRNYRSHSRHPTEGGKTSKYWIVDTPSPLHGAHHISSSRLIATESKTQKKQGFWQRFISIITCS